MLAVFLSTCDIADSRFLSIFSYYQELPLTCNSLREPTLEGYGNLSESRFESTSFVRVQQRYASYQLCSQLDHKRRYNCEYLAISCINGHSESIEKGENKGLISLYTARPGVWDNRRVHYKDRKKRNIFPFKRQDVKKPPSPKLCQKYTKF